MIWFLTIHGIIAITGAAVLELDTPGGDLAATLDLCLWIKDRSPVQVWAWVRPQAQGSRMSDVRSPLRKPRAATGTAV